MALNAAGLDWMVLMSWIMWLMHARAYKTDHQSRLLLEAASMMVETRFSTFFFLFIVLMNLFFNIVTISQKSRKIKCNLVCSV